MRWKFLLVLALIAAALVAPMCFFTVDHTEFVYLTQFGRPLATYDGGELVTHLGTRPVVFKGEPGDAIVYPSTMLHEVKPVRSGQRLVSITFIESMIADEYQRTQLYELNEVGALEGLKMDWQNRVRLELVRQNLFRMWSDK